MMDDGLIVNTPRVYVYLLYFTVIACEHTSLTLHWRPINALLIVY